MRRNTLNREDRPAQRWPTGMAAVLALTALVGCSPDTSTLKERDPAMAAHDRTQEILGAAYEKTGMPGQRAKPPVGEDPDEILRYPNSTLMPGSTASQKLYKTTDDLGVVLDHYRTVLSAINPERSGLGQCDQSDVEAGSEHVTVITAEGTPARGKAFRVEISRVLEDVIIKVISRPRTASSTDPATPKPSH